VIVTVAVAMTMAVIVVVIVWYTLIFQGDRTGKEKVVVTSFRLVQEKSGSWSFLQVGVENQGVVASFWLEP
jgi:hypothetical protein